VDWSPGYDAADEDAGHFLHLEQPHDVNEQILAWVVS